MRTIQLLGEGIEELWQFPDDVTDEDIQKLYKEYMNMEEYESFEDYLDNYAPQVQGERIFVDEVYI